MDLAKRMVPGLDVIRPDYSRNPNMHAQSGVMTLMRRIPSASLSMPFDDHIRCMLRSAGMVTNLSEEYDRSVLERLDIPYELLGDLSAYLSSRRYDSSRFNPGFRGSYLCMQECRAYSRLPDR